MWRIKSLGCVLSVLMAITFSFAQNGQYRFSRLDVSNGLSHNQIKSFFKDRNGFLWIGTSAGLNRFDGYTIKVFRHDSADPYSVFNDDINHIFEGPDGLMWIHTWAGNDVYDPKTESFLHNTDTLLASYNVPTGFIGEIEMDSKGNYWFVHTYVGIFKYSPGKGTASITSVQGDTTSLISNRPLAIELDSKGNIWTIHENGVVEKIDANTMKVVYRSRYIHKVSSAVEYDLMIDNADGVWVHAINNALGLFYLKPGANNFQRINQKSPGLKLNTDIVRSLEQDEKGRIWVATDHGGINVLDIKKGTSHVILNDPDDNESLIQNSVNKLYRDNEGIIWAGSFKKGVCYYHENFRRFTLIRHQKSKPGSLPFDDVNAFAEDQHGNIWMGTNGGGLIYYDKKANTYKQYLNNPRDPNSLSTNVVVCLHIDRDNKLWVGTYFGGLNYFDGKKFIHFKHNPNDPNSVSDDSIWEIYEDSQSNIWIGTLSKGVDVYNRATKKFQHYLSQEPNGISATYITDFIEDKDGNIWVNTGYGLFQRQKGSGRFIQYMHDPSKPQTLSSNNLLSIFEDSRGLIWIGSQSGLNLFNKTNGTFQVFKKSDGLPHNTILTIVEDAHHNLWVTTPNGISHLRINQNPGNGSIIESIRNYDESDGLQGKLFNENAGIALSSGDLMFGGPNGVNQINPDKLVLNNKKPNVIFTDFQVFNKSLAIGEEVEGDVILKQSISETKSITLKHAVNMFSIEFAALSFFHPDKSEYKYKLEGFNKEWLHASGNQRKVTYTNLDPGEYTFTVIASNNDGLWNEVGNSIRIVVLPPFWKTRTAFVLYVMLTFGALLISRKLIQERERLKFNLERERHEAKQMHELDLMKLRFFTNVSHEFRTPLSLILAPIEKILAQTKEGEHKHQFLLIQRNARRLLNLVNQLLDFRRMEFQEVKLNPSEGDIVSFIQETTNSFSDLSDKKHVQFTFSSQIAALETFFDKDKLEKILFNLLSNAFKFTNENGRVDVKVNLIESATDNKKYVEIVVMDTGIGIPEEKLEQVFERFFQNDLPSSMVNQGSGIGLSITKEFVKAHGGTISVTSEVNKGSCFTVVLPVEPINSVKKGEGTEIVQEITEATVAIENEEIEKGSKPLLLLVEDNDDFRFYLKDNLKQQYAILEAANGKEGLKLAQQHIPDLVVSDVMMPEMNGMELCRLIKQDRNTSHIPVVLLTARSAEEQKLEGFDAGANDYVTKPFNFEILMSRIKNLIHQRELFQKDFRKHIEVKASDIAISSLDEKLIENAIRLVEEYIGDPDFSVEHLSREMGMSRVNLYKKLLALTGKPPLEFIRTIRLQRAAQLLEKSQLTVAEVAYKVGFNNPKYFARYFKEEYNMLPSAYAQSKRNKEKSDVE